MKELIEFNNVSYQYQGNRYALKDISLDIKENRKTAIVGANGAGKSTMVLHMNGLFLPSSGEVFFRGQSVGKKNRETMVDRVGLVFQDPDDQIISMNVRDDIAFGPTQRGLPMDEIEKRTEQAMNLLGISHLADRNPNELSYGQKKLVAIAGVIAMDTDVIILDEPMAFLDPKGKQEIQRIMDMLTQKGKTVIITTHDMQLVAEWADDVIVMKEGSCLGKMSPKQLFSNLSLLEDAKLNLPPIAQLISAVWDGQPLQMPIRIEEAKAWLKEKLS
ncbi:energy-coupling factor ABC transporter ATP-binding protein [Aneurinibacillus sp. UBA3580]|jgi:cobalt/nickel transport system ATP-binding protein|uniref:energy-coupling factor ABC transporter ATP-binding protein n=1 Tax=Aneurinibacillus sp. UBA3580 TaxID=1946041 RepID=UPI00257A2FF1|nr:ATP-binding cassette domain-containing protein [Aneurinibacillus sp. UBA3580]